MVYKYVKGMLQLSLTKKKVIWQSLIFCKELPFLCSQKSMLDYWSSWSILDLEILGVFLISYFTLGIQSKFFQFMTKIYNKIKTPIFWQFFAVPLVSENWNWHVGLVNEHFCYETVCNIWGQIPKRWNTFLIK